MLIGICGAKCAGKSTVAQYLIDHHGFKKLHIETPRTENGTSEKTEEEEAQAQTKSEPQTASSSSSFSVVPKPNALPSHLKRTGAPSYSSTHVFPTAQALLDFVTKHWRSRWVTTDIHNEAVFDALSRRPFFLLISVDAPVTVRWRRWQHKQRTASTSTSDPTYPPTPLSPPADTDTDSAASLADFVAQSDAHLYSPQAGGSSGGGGGVLPLMSRAAVRLLNTSSDLAHLYATLGKLDLPDPHRLRPSWDGYFMALASLAARRCNCMKRAVGCVLVDAAHRVLSTGYNGTPRALRNCGEGGCPRCNAGDAASGAALATCLCLHAEENALLEAGRERIRPGSVLYCNTCPCLTCSIKIVQVGIGEVVYNQGYSMDGAAAEVFRAAGVKLRQFSPPANGLIHLEKMELY